MDDETIKRAIRAYEKRQKIDKEKYEKNRLDPEFRRRNTERAKQYYADNKEHCQALYRKRSDLTKARNLYRYWESNGKDLTKIKDKHPDKYTLLKQHGFKNLDGDDDTN